LADSNKGSKAGPTVPDAYCFVFIYITEEPITERNTSACLEKMAKNRVLANCGPYHVDRNISERRLKQSLVKRNMLLLCIPWATQTET